MIHTMPLAYWDLLIEAANHPSLGPTKRIIIGKNSADLAIHD